MKRVIIVLLSLGILSCNEDKKAKTNKLSAQQIVDSSIQVSGGGLYDTSDIAFDFRGKTYILEGQPEKRIQKRLTVSDSAIIADIVVGQNFKRFLNDSLVSVVDSMATKYTNSINSVHYFAYLPNGLNDPAVNKELLGEVRIKENDYYKIKITFDKEDGGVDFEDVYVYWFNKQTLKPDYLAYEFHVDGGGMRFREAFNERFVKGIRFVDYKNYKTVDNTTAIDQIDSLFITERLEFLSNIELENIEVIPDNYN